MIDLEPQEGSTDKEQEKLNPISLPDDGLTVSFLLQTAKKWESNFKSFFNPEKAKIEQFDRTFRTIVDRTESKKRIGMPTAENIVMTVVARLQAILIPSGNLIDAQLEDVITEDEVEEIQKEIDLIENFISQKMVENKDVRRELEDLLIWCAVGGFGVAWNSWTTKERVKFEVDPNSKTGFKEIIRKIGLWMWESVSPFDFAWDPSLTNKPVNKAGWVRRKMSKTLNELKALEQDGFFTNIDQMIKDVGNTRPEGDDDRQRISALGDAAIQNDRLWDVFEYYGDVTYKNNDGIIKVFKAHFFIVNGSWLLRAGKNPLRPQRIPVTWFRYKIRQGQGIGSSIYESIIDLLNEININKGKIGDLTQRLANTPLLVDQRSGLDNDNLWMAPNGIIPVDSVDGIKPLPVPPGALDAARSTMSEDIGTVREATPANEQIQGITGDTGETATKTRSLIAASGIKFQHLSQRAAGELIGPQAQEAYFFYRQFGEDGQMFTHKGGRDGLPVPVLRENLMRDYDFFAITAESETDKIVRIKQLKEAAADLAGLGLGNAVVKLYTKEILPLLGVANAGDIMQDAEPQAGTPEGIPAGTPAPAELPAENVVTPQ